MPEVKTKNGIQKFPYTLIGVAKAKATAKKTGGSLKFTKKMKKTKGGY